MAGANLSGGRSDWLASETTQHGLSRYISTLRERWWLVALCRVVALGGALLYVKTTDKVYEASADLLVSPVSNDDDTTLGLGLIRDSSDPTRDVSTAARYVESIPAAGGAPRGALRREHPRRAPRAGCAAPERPARGPARAPPRRAGGPEQHR